MHRALPWIVAAVMTAGGFLAPWLGPKYFGLSTQDNAALSGALGGALIGAAGALLAMLIADWRQRTAAKDALHVRRENAKKLIAAELINVAMGMISTKRTMDIAIQTASGGRKLPEREHFGRDMPRAMPLTDSLGPELLILDGDAIDALVTLKANLERTGEGMEEITSGRRLFGLFVAQQISAGLQHDMGILAECFDHFAPSRKFKLSDHSEPELASSILRRYAKSNLAEIRDGL